MENYWIENFSARHFCNLSQVRGDLSTGQTTGKTRRGLLTLSQPLVVRLGDSAYGRFYGNTFGTIGTSWDLHLGERA
jgi:hypothetical protein